MNLLCSTFTSHQFTNLFKNNATILILLLGNGRCWTIIICFIQFIWFLFLITVYSVCFVKAVKNLLVLRLPCGQTDRTVFTIYISQKGKESRTIPLMIQQKRADAMEKFHIHGSNRLSGDVTSYF